MFRRKRDPIAEIFSSIPTLQTERLTLRAMRRSDRQDMYEYASDPSVTRYLLWDIHPNEEYTGRYLDYVVSRYRIGDFTDWAVTVTETGKMIGTCGFTRIDADHRKGEVGYVLNPAYWGQGIAAEAVRAVLHFAFFRLKLNRMEAKFIRGNERSLRVMEKCGMQFEGYQREAMLIKGQYCDIGYASILRSEFPE
ncbi:MAG: GNAT family N-acetyltransferase [Clostridia bacterium]|nr:GNAT family N-acetyltransferase [Clostridia bacterium]